MEISRWTSVALAVAIGLLPIVPPEHVHESEEEGHHHVVVHQHLQAHGASHHHDDADHDGDRHPAVDDDDAPVLTLDVVYTVPATPDLIPVAVPVLYSIIEQPESDNWRRPSPYVERLIHGPPRAPTQLRAPPSISSL